LCGLCYNSYMKVWKYFVCFVVFFLMFTLGLYFFIEKGLQKITHLEDSYEVNQATGEYTVISADIPPEDAILVLVCIVSSVVGFVGTLTTFFDFKRRQERLAEEIKKATLERAIAEKNKHKKY